MPTTTQHNRRASDISGNRAAPGLLWGIFVLTTLWLIVGAIFVSVR